MTRIRQMAYDPSDPRLAQVETLTFARLREINDRGTQRADFHVIAVVEAGRGTVSIDFAGYEVQSGDAVWLRPGSVHRWDDIDDLTGDLVLFLPTAPVTAATRAVAVDHDHAPTWTIEIDRRPYVRAAIAHLRLETTGPSDQRSLEVPNLLLSVLLERLGPSSDGPTTSTSLFTAFRRAVETHFRDHHDVAFYAGQLGYSPRTLTRAVERHTGITAKAYISDRIVLEAKRLLAYDRCTAARCGAQLGFPDPSNFSLFFRANVGVRPGAWQRTTSPGALEAT